MRSFTFLLFQLFLLFFANVQAKLNKGFIKNGDWIGPWFPYKPGQPHVIVDKVNREHKGSSSCDDGKNDLAIDYDPEEQRQNYNYLCLNSNRSIYEPNVNTEALLKEHFVPPAYVPQVKCLNETITYDQQLPTYGHFRPLAPQYGSYNYLPPQRWMRNLAEGAIAMLYHPCAITSQITLLRKWIQGCLYAHVITPSQRLSAERPFALLSWGKSLEMSVPEERIVTDFIKENAKHGPLSKMNLKALKVKPYKAGLIADAHLVTNEDDNEICGYFGM